MGQARLAPDHPGSVKPAASQPSRPAPLLQSFFVKRVSVGRMRLCTGYYGNRKVLLHLKFSQKHESWCICSSHGQRSLVLDFPRLEDWSTTHSSPNHLESYYLDHYSLIRQGKSEGKGREGTEDAAVALFSVVMGNVRQEKGQGKSRGQGRGKWSSPWNLA